MSDHDNGLDEGFGAVLDAYALKDEGRTGWQLRGVDEPESVAAHTWGVAYLVLALGDRFLAELPGVELDRALRLAVVHDVAEAETGDVPTRADAIGDVPTRADAIGDVSTQTDATAEPTEEPAIPKATAERDAMATLADPLPDRVLDAFEEYENRESPEAVLVKECDLLDTCFQAVVYERDGRYDPDDGEPDAFREYDALDEFFVTTERRLQTETGRTVFEQLRERYRSERSTDRDSSRTETE